MANQPRSELQELVDAPNETLAVEYKSWLDLNETQAAPIWHDTSPPWQTTAGVRLHN